jgi:nucleoside-diphosphate-sugar epimerase
VRPASISGPRRRALDTGIGLQSALSGKLRHSRSVVHRAVDRLTRRMPVTRRWMRQFVHEDDVVGAIAHLSLDHHQNEPFAIFHLCPPGDVITPERMAEVMGARTLYLSPAVIWFGFFGARHLTRGRIPTSRGVWRFYGYPIAVDGSRITAETGYQYKYDTETALTTLKGRYGENGHNIENRYE